MSIRIEITGDTPQAIAESVISMAFLLAPKLREQSTTPAAEAAEVVEPERKPRRGRKVETIIEHDEKEVAEDVRRDTGGNDAVDGPRAASAAASLTGKAGPAGHSTSGSVDVEADTSAVSKDESAAEVDAVADEPSMSIDALRKFTINEYLNVVTDKLDERKNLYKALLDQFQVEAINALAPGQINAFKAAVEAKIAEALKA